MFHVTPEGFTGALQTEWVLGGHVEGSSSTTVQPGTVGTNDP